MKNKKLRLLSFGLAASIGLLLPSIKAHAAPTYEVHNAGENISGTWASANSDVLIGPNANIIVNGDWYITANNLYIHPSATITGTGTIHIMNPSTYNGKPAATTMLDAGSVVIGPKVSIENGSTVTLTAIDPASYAGSGMTETIAQQAMTSLTIGSSLNFNNTNAHIILGSNNVVFGAAGIITRTDLNIAFPGVDPAPSPASAFLVTNGSGKVTKQVLPSGNNFAYPVGFVASNYTPATVTNTAGAPRDLSVRVSDKATSGIVSGNPTHGINRYWQITGPAAGTNTGNLSLTHETGNQAAGYDNGKDFITQQASTMPGLWDSAAIDPAPLVDARTPVVIPVAGLSSFFSKSDDTNTSISVRLLVSPVALLQGAYSGTSMTTTLNTNGLIPLIQPYNNTPFNYAGNEKVGAIPANVTDWVLVDLRDPTTPSTIIATKAAFMLNNGLIVDLDGVSPVAFKGLVAGNYHVGVRHRNHLGIRTATALALAEETNNSYNFTTSAGQSYQNQAYASTTQVTGSGGTGPWLMRGGNANSNANVRYQGPGNDPSQILSVTLAGVRTAVQSGVYSNSDLDLNGVVRYQGPGNDPNVLLANFLSGVVTSVFIEQL